MSAVTDMQLDAISASNDQQQTKRRYNYRFKPGAPTAYKKAYAHMLVDFAARGYSLTAFAGHIRVSRSCLLKWAEQYPEFRVAVDTAKAARTECLEREALEAESAARINFRVAALKNCAPEDWRDTQSIEITQNINVAVTLAQALDALSTKTIEGVLHDDSATSSSLISDMRAEPVAIEAIEARDVGQEQAGTEAPLPGSILDPSMSK